MASVVVLHEGRVLLTKREDFEVWCVPSGGVEPGETIQEAAIRETVEESGYRVEVDRLVGVYSTLGDWPDMHSCAFAAHPVSNVAGALKTPDEVLAVDWFDPSDLPEPMLWWQVQRIVDALAGRTGVVSTERVRSRLGLLSREDLYQARDASGMSRSEFFAWNFGRVD